MMPSFPPLLPKLFGHSTGFGTLVRRGWQQVHRRDRQAAPLGEAHRKAAGLLTFRKGDCAKHALDLRFFGRIFVAGAHPQMTGFGGPILAVQLAVI
jgi:hypothetical protein